MNQQLPRILCVDDEPRNTSLLESILTPRGYEVVAVSNGLDALRKIGTERIDLCLLDVMMPGMDGFELCRRIKSDEEQKMIPIIMITACLDKKNHIRGIEAGAENFITKPFDTLELLARIKMLLHAKAHSDQLDSVYHHVTRLNAFSEETIATFDPTTFDFMEMVNTVVAQIIRRRWDLVECPEIVIIGIMTSADICQWLRFDVRDGEIVRSCISMNLNRCSAFSEGNYYNEQDARLTTMLQLRWWLKKQTIMVSNMVRYSNDNFCIIAINYGREVSMHDETILRSVVSQTLCLRSLAVQVGETRSAFDYTVFALARASEVNDICTGDHILRVGKYSALLARQLLLPEKIVENISIQSVLHDVGKIHLSPAILNTTEPLTNDQLYEMKKHPLYSSKIIGKHAQMAMASRIALSHHECYDGSGYPFGLSGDQIPMEGRIVNLADQYDALRSVRSYKPALDHETVYRIITEGDGRTLPRHFDPAVLKAFKALEGQFSAAYDQALLDRPQPHLVSGGSASVVAPGRLSPPCC